MWNAWCTARRFQEESRCAFGCNLEHPADSLEHYFFCPILVNFATNFLQLPTHLIRSPGHFLMVENFANDDEIISAAHLTYTAYASYHHLRHPPIPPSTPDSPSSHLSSTLACLRRFLQQAVFARPAVRGSIEKAKRAFPLAAVLLGPPTIANGNIDRRIRQRFGIAPGPPLAPPL